MKVNRYTLSNGLRIVHEENNDFQMVYVNLLYGVGSRNECSEYTGIAHLFEHLMFEGTENIPSIDEPLERAGGENNAYTSKDVTNYNISLPANNAELAFWIESDRICNLSLCEENVKGQRKVVIEEFKQTHLNKPYGDADMLLRSLAYKTHPYRWTTIGRRPSHIAKVPVEHLTEFYERYYAPDNAVLAVVGNITFDEVIRLSKKWFGKIPAKGYKAPELPQEQRQRRQRRRKVVRDVPSDALYMAFHMGGRRDRDYVPCDVLSDILANGYSGRLKQSLMKEQKLFSRIDAFIMGSEDPGLFCIHSRVAEGVDIADAETAIWKELKKLQDEVVSGEELEKVRNRYESEHLFRNIAGDNLANNLALAEMRGNAEDFYREVEMYHAITAEELQSTAKELFREGNSNVLYYLKRR